ncbi:hypothetical protein G6011_11474 [Alternaria panax]|uniref:Uncharacterized protein n=1 Tax=Alternaria panax TaxID=48097 RepID=A0AAD4IDR3_9PLEO|nr:hypothetical protein G6011_11474 [Alternaria panax]
MEVHDEVRMVQTTLHHLPSRPRPELLRASGWKVEAVRNGQYESDITRKLRQITFMQESKSVCGVVRLSVSKSVKIETEVAADKSDSGFNGRYNNDRGNDMGWHPSQEATADSHVVGNSSDAQERSSLLPSCVGYYVEDEVDWGMENHDPPMAKSKKPDQHYVHPQRESMVREPYLGLAHFKNANIDEIPPTVQDLRAYDYRIKVMFESKAKNQRFANGGNGKVAPALYGSEQRHDLGLCFATFLTRKRCEMGVNCPWRHHPLSNAEKAWIIEYGKKKGKEFIDNVDRWWSHPEVPVPGATMQGLGEKDT